MNVLFEAEFFGENSILNIQYIKTLLENLHFRRHYSTHILYIIYQSTQNGCAGRVLIVFSLHCNENPIYVLPEKELRVLSVNFHIHMSAIDLYIPRIVPHIFMLHNRQTDRGKI